MIKLIGLSALALGFILHFVEWLYDFKLNGWSFATVISVALLIERTHHNHQTRLMLKIIGTKVGVEWQSYLQENGLKRIYPRLLKYSTKLKGKKEKTMLTNILKANLSKKLISALVAIGVAALNQKFGLNLSENDITLILGLSLAHISLQTIIDSIKAWALSKSAVIVQQSVPIVQNLIEKSALDPKTTYKDLYPTIKSVHEGINKIYADAQKNDASQAFKDAASAYLAIKDYIKSNQQPNPLPEIQQESA